jgi:hypothetical protein
MKYIFTLKDSVTGYQRDYIDSWDYSEDGLIFYWTDGNFGCDCNRALALWNWSDEAKDIPCNVEGNRIRLLRIAEQETGHIIHETEQELNDY